MTIVQTLTYIVMTEDVRLVHDRLKSVNNKKSECTRLIQLYKSHNHHWVSNAKSFKSYRGVLRSSSLFPVNKQLTYPASSAKNCGVCCFLPAATFQINTRSIFFYQRPPFSVQKSIIVYACMS